MATSNLGAKRSLFKKPAWASTSTNVASEEDTPIFGQSNLYEDILEAQKKQRERHALRQKERAEKEKQKEQERQVKRRRISEAEDSDDGNDGDGVSHRSGSVSSQQSQTDVPPVAKIAPTRSHSTPQKPKGRLVDRLDSPRTTRTRSQKKESTPQHAAIVLDDDGFDDHEDAQNEPENEDADLYGPPKTKKTPPKQKSKTRDPESESEEEDEYLRQLKAEARQKARLKQLGIGTGKENTPDATTSQTSLLSPSPGDGSFASPNRQTDPANTHTTRAVSTPDDDPEVKIWIKTIIPGAKDLIVGRKISQPLDKVKEFWIKRNELDPAIAAKVFFTWNNTQLYNSTTMRGIIERLKKTHPLKNGGDPSNGQIMIEAVTDEIFEYRQKQRARRLAEAETQSHSPDDDHDESIPDNPSQDHTTSPTTSTSIPAPAAPKDGIVIKLKAQGLEDMMLRVRPTTTMAKILSGYCRVRGVDAADGRCWLSYDGDRLEGAATVDQVGFEHDDSVDVYIR